MSERPYSDWFATRDPARSRARKSYGPGETIPRKVVKAGSHLCDAELLSAHRPAARRGEAIDTSTGHIRLSLRHSNALTANALTPEADVRS